MAPKKKARLQSTFTTIALKSTCQVGKLLRALDPQELAEASGTGLAHGSLKNKISETLHETDKVQTPYGTLVQQMKIAKADDSGFIEVPVINPFALLHFISVCCPEFGDFMEEWLKTGSRLAIYFDGVSPSDGLRLEHGRDYYAVFYTWLEFPQWLLARHDVGWITFGVIPERLVKEGTVTVASIFKAVLLTFFFARRSRLEYGADWSQAQMQPRRFRIAIDVRLFVGGRKGD